MVMSSPIKALIYSLTPVLEVNDLEDTLEYYQNILGFSIDWTWPNEGKVDHASVSFGEGHTEEGEHDDLHAHIQLSQAEKIPVMNSGWLYFTLKDGIDELYQQMKERGADISSEIGNRPWGNREFDVKDNNGHIMRFAWPIPITD
jgi:uncharacterized glyoxalase superfamily protein PhnB